MTLTLNDCEEIFRRARLSDSEQQFRDIISPLLSEYKILSLDFGRGSIFWRGRLIEREIYQNIADLDYPPVEYARQGRMNDCGVPCFYVSARRETAIKEIEAVEGQMIQLAGFRVKSESPLRLAVIGEYSNVWKSGYMHFVGRDPGMTISKLLNTMPQNEALKIIYMDMFFADILDDLSASRNEYRLSRALSKLIYQKTAADGIIFPSVKDRGGFNIAVKSEPSDNSFLNVCCLLVKMEKIREYGLIEYSILNSAERLDEKRNFVWRTGMEAESVGMYNLTKNEADIASGHPDSRNALLHMLHLYDDNRSEKT